MARVVNLGGTRAKRSRIRVNKSSCRVAAVIQCMVGGLSSSSNVFWLIDLDRTYHIERIFERTMIRYTIYISAFTLSCQENPNGG
jgi:hypothetical protein